MKKLKLLLFLSLLYAINANGQEMSYGAWEYGVYDDSPYKHSTEGYAIYVWDIRPVHEDSLPSVDIIYHHPRNGATELKFNKTVNVKRTRRVWKDNVQQKFFSEHISPLRSEYDSFVSVMEEVSDTFIKGEQAIKSLMH